MPINPLAPSLSDSTNIVDTTNTNLLLFMILQALDEKAAQMLPDDLATSIIGNENLQ